MNINSVTSLLPGNLQPLAWTANINNSAGSAASVQQSADTQTLSPAAQFLSQLQQLQTQNPQQFQSIVTQISGRLQQAATAASNQGNTAQASQLNALAQSFQNAGSGGALPTAQQLQQAGLGGHHHGGGHHHHAGSGIQAYSANAALQAQTQNQSLAASLFGSLTPTQSIFG